MSDFTRRGLLKTGAVLSGTILGVSGSGLASEDSKKAASSKAPLETSKQDWVGTWTASPEESEDENEPTFTEQTFRFILRTSVGGRGIRVRFANTFGDTPLTINDAAVGIQDTGASLVSGTNQPVTFDGNRSVTVPAGARFYSDPVPLAVPPERDLAVSLSIEDPPATPTTHSTALKTSYAGSGNLTDTTSSSGFDSEITAWYFLDGIDVVNPDTVGAVVCLGNSITDGSRATLDADSTYPDLLAERLNDEPRVRKSVLNAGIGGNRLLHDYIGENALARLDRDVLTQTGATDVILLEGINDIGFSEQDPDDLPDRDEFAAVTADEIIRGMKQIITRVRAKGLRIYGGTLTPFEGAAYYYAEGEEKRQTVNEFIRTSGAFDGVIDFDKAIRDPDNPNRILPEYDSGDNIHPNDAGYQAMADAVNLELLVGRKNKAKGKSVSAAGAD